MAFWFTTIQETPDKKENEEFNEDELMDNVPETIYVIFCNEKLMGFSYEIDEANVKVRKFGENLMNKCILNFPERFYEKEYKPFVGEYNISFTNKNSIIRYKQPEYHIYCKQIKKI